MPIISIPSEPSDFRSSSPVKCRNCRSAGENSLAVGFERWYAEHAGVIPRIFTFCYDSDVTCCGYPLSELVWMPAEDILNFAETIRLSRLALTERAERELDSLIDSHFDV